MAVCFQRCADAVKMIMKTKNNFITRPTTGKLFNLHAQNIYAKYQENLTWNFSGHHDTGLINRTLFPPCTRWQKSRIKSIDHDFRVGSQYSDLRPRIPPGGFPSPAPATRSRGWEGDPGVPIRRVARWVVPRCPSSDAVTGYATDL